MSVKAAFLVALMSLAGSALSAFAQFADQAPGQRFHIDPTHLARPYATESAENEANLVARPAKPAFRLPPGFSTNEFAGGFQSPRCMARGIPASRPATRSCVCRSPAANLRVTTRIS